MNVFARRIVYAAVFALIAAYGYFSLRGSQGIPALMEKQREIREMEEQNAAIQRENQYRHSRIQKLKENPSEQEMEIRKQLKLLRPGETSFILPEGPKQDQSQPSDAAAPK